MQTTLQQLFGYGQSPWVDYLARPFVRDGELARLMRAGVLGVTSNPTIFRDAITGGDAYDDRLRELFRTETEPKEVFLALAAEDVREACDVLRPAFDLSRTGRDGWVSLEVDPRFADDAGATVAEARRLRALVDRPNLMVKIPGTEAGLAAIEETIAHGIPVNVTLLFSLERHRQAAEAYLRGLRRFLAAGGDLSTVASVASFFVSRVDAEADRRLAEAGGPAALRGTLAVANARLAYQTCQQVFSGPEWTDLHRAGAHPQWCLWASTSMKDEDRRDVEYVEQLIGPGTVDTMPPSTAEAFLEHGRVGMTLDRETGSARETIERFQAAGIDYDGIVALLERQGVEKFRTSFAELLDGIERKRGQLLAGQGAGA
ncbi:transaldolase [Amycolatopsis benzoatilytica]|uniref:transaldolase n=1 Tax=Amycolatopsis benzoatilytica TaxID=346045 RepID=UPI00035F2A3C|nr:transaldolase [Amycolatopsis benzoatilytica]